MPIDMNEEKDKKKERTVMEMKEFIEKVNHLRGRLNIAKNSYNKFGNFKYRSLPDIFSGIQNNLAKLNFYVEITDELISDPLCIKSKAILSDGQNKIESTAHAMIGTKTNKDGKAQMDMSQQTGSATSYARKYALEALFLLADDNCSDSVMVDSPSSHKDVENAPNFPPPTQKPPVEPFKIEETTMGPSESLPCPKCKNGKIEEKPKAIGCSAWRDGCSFSFWRNDSDLNLDDVRQILSGKESRIFTMKKKDGNTYRAKYYISDDIEPRLDFNCDELEVENVN